MSVQFSWQAGVIKSDLEGNTKLVLLVIGTYMNQHGDGAFPSYKTISAGASVSRSTVIRHVEIAVMKGWLKKRSRMRLNGSSGRLEADSNTYLISFPEVVQSEGGGSTVTPPLVAQCDHPSVTVTPPLVSPCDPNTPVLTPQLTQKPPAAPEGGNAEGGKSKRRKREEVTFADFLDACHDAGEKAIRTDDPIFGFARDVGIPKDFLRLAWREFSRKHLDSDKRQKDWRAHYRDTIRRNWLGLWFIADVGGCTLTTAGKQLMLEWDAERAREMEQAA